MRKIPYVIPTWSKLVEQRGAGMVSVHPCRGAKCQCTPHVRYSRRAMIVLAAASIDASVSWLAEIAGLRGLWVGLNAIVLAILVLGYFPQKPTGPQRPTDRR